MLEITLLPARQGDAIWIRWGKHDDVHQMIIDMGTEEIGKRVRKDILNSPEDQRRFDLLVITHVDRDHIGGVLTCLAEADPIPGLQIKDMWFNGFQHLNEESVNNTLEPMGPAQGERLSSWLRHQPWNEQFNGYPVCRRPGEAPQEVTLHGGLKLTVLGPTPERLSEFVPTWKDEVEKALRKGRLTEVSPGLEAMGPKQPPVLEYPNDLRALAETSNSPDDSPANGSSISLLLEYKDRKVILSGDAFADDLVEGIQAVNGNDPLQIDAFKLPHHGSKNNIFKTLIKSVDCPRWLFSTDGTQFRHPDPVALARVITHSTTPDPVLFFNVPSTFNSWWDNDGWRNMYNYQTEYGSKEDGITLKF